MIQLRPHQSDLIKQTRKAMTHHKSVLLYAAPGAGKTVMAAYMARGVQDKGKRAIFACHRDAILNQTAKTFDQFGMGGECCGHFETTRYCIISEG